MTVLKAEFVPRTSSDRVRICPRWKLAIAAENRLPSSCNGRYAMAGNEWTSTEMLEALAEDETPYVQLRAWRTQALVKAKEILLIDRGRS